jgi:signal transduction histidine kinase/ActR/RegA family two-component response regulator
MTPSSSLAEAATHHRDSTDQEILAVQVRLLFANANVGVAATLIAASILARLQWQTSPHQVIFPWLLYMCLISVARFVLARRYRRTAPSSLLARKWGTAFAIGAGLSGTGWGAAAILLYPGNNLANQVFLIFILGGMMLGSVSILAPWPAAFVAFIVPTGLAPTGRLLWQDDEVHLAMGLLAGVFTVATLVTTIRLQQTIVSSLKLQFENRDLVEDLQTAKNHADALNERLEVRVQERTAELQRSSEQLRAETAQREQVEEELLRARKLESLGVLAGGIAHDFNNFLTVVQGNIELAKMDLAPDSPVQEVLDQTAIACARAAFLSSQLLTFAKGGAPVRRLYPVARLVMDAVHLARAGAQTSIDVNISDDLWFAEVDPSQIGQVLHNILLNARQAMPEGGIIEIHAENALDPAPGAGPRVKISIRDYGHGIPAHVLPRVFDPYFTTKPGGSGLGLATAYAIIAKHGGTLSVESKPGRGTLFTIDLPASQEHPAEPAPESPALAHVHAGTGRVLIMDDEEALRKLLKTVLTTLGYQVHTARDGAEAIALFEHERASGRGFDAVLLDLTVGGGMGGMEAAAKLKELDPGLKLIVSSGYSHAPVMADYREYGFDDVVPKPWTIPELSKVLRRVLALDPDRNAKA